MTKARTKTDYDHQVGGVSLGQIKRFRISYRINSAIELTSNNCIIVYL